MGQTNDPCEPCGLMVKWVDPFQPEGPG